MRLTHLIISLIFLGQPAFSEADTVSISGGWEIYKEENQLFLRDNTVSPFTCVAQTVSARGQVLNIRVFPTRYQVNIELPYLYFPIKTQPETVYFNTDSARLFSASTRPGLDQAYARLYDGRGYVLFLALQSVADFEVVFLASPFIYNGLNNAEMLEGLMACAERQLDDFDISSR